MFSLESPHRGDSNEYTQYTISNIKQKITLNYPNLQLCDFFKGFKNECETAVVNEPSVFEPMKFYCILYLLTFLQGLITILWVLPIIVMSSVKFFREKAQIKLKKWRIENDN